MPTDNTPKDTANDGAALSRRSMLMKLGLAATAAYAAPVMLKLGEAHASGGSGSGGRGRGGGRSGGPGGPGRAGHGRGGRGSFSGFGGRRRVSARRSTRSRRRTFRLRSLFT